VNPHRRLSGPDTLGTARIAMSTEIELGADADSPLPPPARFEKIASPQTVDYALRTVQQGLVHFSAMADAKANILITICALLFSVGLTQLEQEEIRTPLLTLLATAVVSLVLAILAVVPRSVSPAPPGRRETGRPPFNPLFFMHISTLDADAYLDEMDALMSNRPGFYEAILRDIYGQGVALANRKYRLLRWSYTVLLAGIGAALLLVLAQSR
jgi:hypothetical protein